MEGLAYCPYDSSHGKWLDHGWNCPHHVPRQTFNIVGPKGTFTESFSKEQTELLCRMGFIKYESTHHYSNGSMTHFYVVEDSK